MTKVSPIKQRAKDNAQLGFFGATTINIHLAMPFTLTSSRHDFDKRNFRAGIKLSMSDGPVDELAIFA